MTRYLQIPFLSSARKFSFKYAWVLSASIFILCSCDFRWPSNSAGEKQDSDGWDAWPTQPTQPSLSVPSGGQSRQRSAFTPATLSGSSPSPVLGQVHIWDSLLNTAPLHEWEIYSKILPIYQPLLRSKSVYMQNCSIQHNIFKNIRHLSFRLLHCCCIWKES